MKRWYLLLLLAAFPLCANATLGERADSVEKRETRGSSTVGIHEVASNGGFVLREYVTADGTVFGCAWSGSRHPDLSVVLGRYADEFRQQDEKTPRKPGQRRFRSIDTGTLVVERWGHMRQLGGRAYIRSLMPSGVSSRDLN